MLLLYVMAEKLLTVSLRSNAVLYLRYCVTYSGENPMSKTTAERQAAYRAKRPLAGVDNNGERRINTWVDTGTYLALKRLARHNGVTRREMLKRVLLAEDARVTAGMDEAEREAYL
jgi:hypothetical protein